MDVIFNNALGSPTPEGDLDEYEMLVKKVIEDSVDYEQSYLAGAREENQKYYYGMLPHAIGSEDPDEAANRSSIVSTDVRDTILSVLPSLIRIFASSENVVYFMPRTEEQEPMAKQCTEYARYVFWDDNDGFLTMHSLLKDALTVKTGIARVWTDTDYEVTEKTFKNITQEQYQVILYELPDVEVVDLEGGEGEDGVIESVTFRHVVSKPRHRIEAIPPEQFRIARDATSLATAKLVGYEGTHSLSDLVKKGYDPEELVDFITTNVDYSDERYIRNPGMIEADVQRNGVHYGEYFIRIDQDGDGIDELRHICVVGQTRMIISDEVVDDNQFAVFSPDPRPHAVIGDCLADITKDIQKIKTNMLRANLDNLAEANNPRTVINELLTNVEDALNDEVGAVIRTRGDPNSAVAFSKVPYVGDQILNNMEYMDKVRTGRTGISEASKGLDPKAMQSTALSGIDAIVSGAQERIELIARILAETGFKRLFKLLLREIVNNPNQIRTIKLTGGWTEVNPSLFDPDMRVSVNPTLGKGTDNIRLGALQEVKNTQMMILEKYGMDNPVVSPIEFRNTIVDILAIANIKNVSRYFKEIDEATLQAIVSAPKEPDPATLLAQAELEKVKASMVKAISEQEVNEEKVALQRSKQESDDDFRRDKLNADTLTKLVEFGREDAMARAENYNQIGK